MGDAMPSGGYERYIVVRVAAEDEESLFRLGKEGGVGGGGGDGVDEVEEVVVGDLSGSYHGKKVVEVEAKRGEMFQGGGAALQGRVSSRGKAMRRNETS